MNFGTCINKNKNNNPALVDRICDRVACVQNYTVHNIYNIHNLKQDMFER